MAEAEDRDRLRYLQLKQKQAAAAQVQAAPEPEPVVAPEPTPELGGVDTARGALQSLNRGTMLGFGDEIVGGGRALLDLLDPESWKEGAQTLGESYRMYRDDERQVTEQFADENPGTALALEVGGSFASPANVVGGPGSTLLKRLGRGAGEGAVAGAGAAEELSDIPKDVAIGATVGAGATGTFELLGGLVNQATKKRIAESLDKADGTFKPYHMIADNIPADIQRNVVGRAYGGKRVLAEQEKPFIDAAQSKVDAASEKARELAESTKRAAEDAVEETRLDAIAEGQLADVARAGQREMAKIDDVAAGTAAGTAAARTRAEDAATAAVETGAKKLQRDAIDAAMPATMTAKERAAIQAMAPRDAERAISAWFGRNGFNMVKERDFVMDGDLAAKLQKLVDADPAIKLELGDIADRVAKMQKGIGQEGAESISGADMMAMRNVFARLSNTGTPSFKGATLNSVKEQFDDVIVDQLGEKVGKSYRAEMTTWGVKKRLSKATERARKRGEDFDAKDWLAKTGDAPLQAQADEVIGSGKRLTKALAKSKTDAAEAASAAGLEARAAKTAARGQTRAAEKSVKRQTKKLKKTAKVQRSRAARVEKRTAAEVLTKAKDELSTLKKGTVPENVSGLSSLLTTSLLGGLGFLAGGGVGAVVSGAGVARGMASKPAQRALAGQAGWQKAIQKLSKTDRAKLYAKLIREGVSREAALSATGE